MRAIIIGALVLLAGCSNQSRVDYYSAVQQAAEAQAKESQARYEALSRMAAGDGEASVAAVMAIALSQRPVIQPQYIEDDALKWASVLAGPLTSVAALWVQADLSRDLNDSNRDIAVARINAEAATDQYLYERMTTPSAPSLPAASLDTIVGGLVDLGNAGILGVQSMGDTGIAGVQAVGESGIAGVQAIGTTALDATSNLSLEAMTNIVTTANTGFTTLEEVVKHDNITLDNIIEHLTDDCGLCTPIPPCMVCETPTTVTPPTGPVFSPQPPGTVVSPNFGPSPI